MVVLLAVVLVLMFAASRPEVWVHLVPSLDSKPPENIAKTNVEIAAAADGKTSSPRLQEDQARHPGSDPTKLRLIGLIVLAILYFGWRFARMGRTLSRHRQPKRVSPPTPESTPPNSNGS
jgi:hypothetical protein